MDKLKSIECDPKCGFMIRSHDEKEVINIAKEHAKKAISWMRQRMILRR